MIKDYITPAMCNTLTCFDLSKITQLNFIEHIKHVTVDPKGVTAQQEKYRQNSELENETKIASRNSTKGQQSHYSANSVWSQ